MLVLKEKAQVIMLPTKDLTNISKSNQLGLAYMKEPCTIHTEYISNQHLYIVSNEKIKGGDYAISDNRTLRKIVGDNHSASQGTYSYKFANKEGWKKIIATTDTSLTNIKGEFNFDKIPSEMPVESSLPQPTQEWIENYIKEYNKGNVITDILVEYEKTSYTNRFTNVNKNGVLNPDKWGNYTNLKISKDNTITIHPIKDSWSREEVEELCRKAVRDNCNLPISQQPYSFKEVKELENKWIEENL